MREVADTKGVVVRRPPTLRDVFARLGVPPPGEPIEQVEWLVHELRRQQAELVKDPRFWYGALRALERAAAEAVVNTDAVPTPIDRARRAGGKPRRFRVTTTRRQDEIIAGVRVQIGLAKDEDVVDFLVWYFCAAMMEL